MQLTYITISILTAGFLWFIYLYWILYDATDITEIPRKPQYTTTPELPLIL
jgi:hypothetical protein